MRNLPHGWESATLRDAALPGREGFMDGDWIEAPYITDAGIRLIQTGNLGVGTFIDKPETRKYISAASYRILNCTSVNSGDVLICRLADPIGRACEVPDTVGDAITAVDCTITRVDQSRYDKSFVLHWLNSERNLKAAADKAAGSTRSRISRSNLGMLPLARPPRDEQSAIGQVLDTLDTTIRQTQAIIEKLKQVKHGLLHDLLTRGIDVNGDLRPPQSEAPHLYKESVLGWMPREWEVRPAEDVCEAVIDCKNRTPPATTSGYAVIRTPNVRDGRFIRKDLAFTDAASFVTWTQRGTPRVGDVLITREAPVGEVCLLPAEIGDACLGQRMMMYRPAKNVLKSDFMLVALLSEPVQKMLADLSGGSTVGHVRVGDIRTLAIPIPALGEQTRIASCYAALEKRCQTEEALLEKLSTQKLGLMDDLLTGRVRVTSLPA